MSVYDAVHVVDFPGASDVTGQLTPPTLGSVTTIEASVTLPVFVTTNVYGSVAPADVPDSRPATLSNVMLGAAGISVSTVSVADVVSASGSVPVTVAVLAT